jgi:hypothetical protein
LTSLDRIYYWLIACQLESFVYEPDNYVPADQKTVFEPYRFDILRDINAFLHLNYDEITKGHRIACLRARGYCLKFIQCYKLALDDFLCYLVHSTSKVKKINPPSQLPYVRLQTYDVRVNRSIPECLNKISESKENENNHIDVFDLWRTPCVNAGQLLQSIRKSIVRCSFMHLFSVIMTFYRPIYLLESNG